MVREERRFEGEKNRTEWNRIEQNSHKEIFNDMIYVKENMKRLMISNKQIVV
jgi:hypothetical protein